RNNLRILKDAACAARNLIERRAAETKCMPVALFPKYVGEAETAGRYLSDYFYTEALPKRPQIHCTIGGEILQSFDCLLMAPEDEAAKSPTLLEAFVQLGVPVVRLTEEVINLYEKKANFGDDGAAEDAARPSFSSSITITKSSKESSGTSKAHASTARGSGLVLAISKTTGSKSSGNLHCGNLLPRRLTRESLYGCLMKKFRQA
ncbi:unnamed protein product, partial [Amoebophrya sp. A120]